LDLERKVKDQGKEVIASRVQAEVPISLEVQSESTFSGADHHGKPCWAQGANETMLAIPA